MRRNWCRQAFIFPGTDDPNVAGFDVVLVALVHVHPSAEERFLKRVAAAGCQRRKRRCAMTWSIPASIVSAPYNVEVAVGWLTARGILRGGVVMIG